MCYYMWSLYCKMVVSNQGQSLQVNWSDMGPCMFFHVTNIMQGLPTAGAIFIASNIYAFECAR